MVPGLVEPQTIPPARPFEIPTVDISAFLKNPARPVAQEILNTIRNACQSTGFFQIIGHGVAKSLQHAVFKGSKQFFGLPMEIKKELDAKKVRGHRGYDVLASQSYEAGILPDLKEGFFIGEDIPDEDPRVEQRRFFMGRNVWPDPSLIRYSEFQQPAEIYHKELSALSIQVLRLIEHTLPYGPGIFDQFVSDNPITPVRIVHYPPASDNNGRQYGSSAHTDFGAITLLLQDQNPGLEVRDNKTGEWVSVPPDPDAYVVNIGDMLSFWTKGEYVSSVHRVVNRNLWARYSIVFFFQGNIDTELRALDGSEADLENPLTVEQHLLRRMTDSYSKK